MLRAKFKVSVFLGFVYALSTSSLSYGESLKVVNSEKHLFWVDTISSEEELKNRFIEVYNHLKGLSQDAVVTENTPIQVGGTLQITYWVNDQHPLNHGNNAPIPYQQSEVKVKIESPTQFYRLGETKPFYELRGPLNLEMSAAKFKHVFAAIMYKYPKPTLKLPNKIQSIKNEITKASAIYAGTEAEREIKNKNLSKLWNSYGKLFEEFLLEAYFVQYLNVTKNWNEPLANSEVSMIAIADLRPAYQSLFSHFERHSLEYLEQGRVIYRTDYHFPYISHAHARQFLAEENSTGLQALSEKELLHPRVTTYLCDLSLSPPGPFKNKFKWLTDLF